jgi:acyl carrier protein
MALENLPELERELVELIRETCRLVDPAPEGLDPDAPLVGPESPLGLDSLDMVEVVVAVQARYNVQLGGRDDARRILTTLRSLADFLRTSRPTA